LLLLFDFIINKSIFAHLKNNVMAVTRLKRKDRRNKEFTRVRKTNLKNVKKMVYIQSPYKEVSGIVLEDQA
jgi:hypothetical protein